MIEEPGVCLEKMAAVLGLTALIVLCVAGRH